MKLNFKKFITSNLKTLSIQYTFDINIIIFNLYRERLSILNKNF